MEADEQLTDQLTWNKTFLHPQSFLFIYTDFSPEFREGERFQTTMTHGPHRGKQQKSGHKNMISEIEGDDYFFTRSWGRVPPGGGRRARFGDPREPRDIAYIDLRSRPWRGFLYIEVSGG